MTGKQPPHKIARRTPTLVPRLVFPIVRPKKIQAGNPAPAHRPLIQRALASWFTLNTRMAPFALTA